MTDAAGPVTGRVSSFIGILLVAVIAPTLAVGQVRPPESSAPADTTSRDTVTRVIPLRGVNVTGTREPREVFHTPAPVLVIDRQALDARVMGGIADLLAEAPGLDVAGVGYVRRSPIIRGLHGQRILLLQDGVRLNHPRREVNRGEPLALGDPASLSQVEVVRGPASVLYGSDAIGGVLNLITAPPFLPPDRRLRGHLELGAGSADSGQGAGGVEGRMGRILFRLDGGFREMGSYAAPAGRFGELELPSRTPVHDSGGRERRLSGSASVPLGTGEFRLRHERYRAEDTGFGYVDPAVLGGNPARVRIHMPRQEFARTSLAYSDVGVGRRIADRVEAIVHLQGNERVFVTDVFAPLVAGSPAGAGVSIVSENETDLASGGARLEVRKLATARALFTYGIDLSHDRSTNADTSTTTIIGMGPPRVSGRATSGVPNAALSNFGIFAQGELQLRPATGVTAGVRRQGVRAWTRPAAAARAEDESHDDAALVGSLSLLQRLGGGTNLVASVARGFRSPNLVERFYSGPTPEGRGIWIRNPALTAETSRSIDVGIRHRGPIFHLEAFVFQNTLYDGIRLVATGRDVEGMREYRNENLDELRFRGVELAPGVRLPAGVSITISHTHLRAENVRDPATLVSDSYRTRTVGLVRFQPERRPLWVEYGVRHTGRHQHLEPGLSPVGDSAPAYAVQSLRGGVRLPGHDAVVELTNLADRLYADAANTSFFRPAPGRTVAIRWRISF